MNSSMYTLTPLTLPPLSWTYIDKVVETADENPIKKQLLREALNFLKQELGKGFFDTCGANHPISIKLTSNIYLTDELIDFTKALMSLKGSDPSNYEKLLSKLKPRKKCQEEGIPFLDIYRSFSPNGLEVRFIDEVLGQKNADIEIRDPESGESIFVEVSQLGQSRDQKKSQQQHRRLSNTFLHYGFDLPKACKLRRSLREIEMERVVGEIKRIKDKAAADQTLEFFEDDCVMMAAAHPNCLAELDTWCNARGLQRNAMEGFELNFNETPRLVKGNKIAEEIKQLPVDRPGMIYIPVSFLYFFKMDVPETAVAIMEQLSGFSHCIGVQLFAAFPGTLLSLAVIEVGDSRWSISEKNGITRHSLFVENPAFNLPLSIDTSRKFRLGLQ